MKNDMKGFVAGLALLALIPAAAKAQTTPVMVANHQVQFEDGSGRYTQVFKYAGHTTARAVFRYEYGIDAPTSLTCRPTVCVATYAPTVLDGSAKIRLSLRRAGRFTIATARGTYCLGAGYTCSLPLARPLPTATIA